MIRCFRSASRRPEGQALVIACLMMLILSIAVITTVNLGHNINERIRLQNTADASAYSMAAMEARAFNFYAFVNRTHVSHYVSAMLMQTLLSVVFWFEAFLTDVFGLVLTISICANPSGVFWNVACPILRGLPIIGAILSFVIGLVSIFRGAVQIAQNLIGKNPINFDRAVGKYFIPGINVLNKVMTAMSSAVMVSAYTHITGSADTVIKANDPNINSPLSQLVGGVISACAFRMAHDPGAYPGIGGQSPGGGLAFPNPFSSLDPAVKAGSDKIARAKRVMGGISNATRYAADKGSGIALWHNLQTNRGIGQLLLGFLPPSLAGAKDFIDNIVSKRGQTRMLSSTYARGKNVRKANFIREKFQLEDVPTGQLSQGDNIGADDTYSIGIGPDEFDLLLVSVDNPLMCGDDEYESGGNGNSNNKWRECWGDPRHDQTDGNGIHKYAMKPSIWALNPSENTADNGGVHWRLVSSTGNASSSNNNIEKGRVGTTHQWAPVSYEFGFQPKQVCLSDSDCKNLGLNNFKRGVGPVDLALRIANVVPLEDRNHPWPGIAPFMHFEPGQYSNACQNPASANKNEGETYAREFNQPSTWVLLNKTPEELQNPLPDLTGASHNKPALLNDDAKLTMQLGTGGGTTLELDNKRARLPILPLGMNVVSRGQTYYHRPGNWQEQPNFFNPYWRPRLASVYQGKYSWPYAQQLFNALPSQFGSITQKIVTH